MSRTGASTTRTNWRASATTSQRVHSRLSATASLVGATVLGAPETSTIWNAIAVASQSVQRAAAWRLVGVVDHAAALAG